MDKYACVVTAPRLLQTGPPRPANPPSTRTQPSPVSPRARALAMSRGVGGAQRQKLGDGKVRLPQTAAAAAARAAPRAPRAQRTRVASVNMCGVSKGCVGHTSVHSDRGSRAWGSGDCASCVSQQQQQRVSRKRTDPSSTRLAPGRSWGGFLHSPTKRFKKDCTQVSCRRWSRLSY